MQNVTKLIHARTDWESIEEGLKNVNSYHELVDLLAYEFFWLKNRYKPEGMVGEGFPKSSFRRRQDDSGQNTPNMKQSNMKPKSSVNF